MSQSRFLPIVIVLCLIAILSAVVIAAGQMGVFDARELMARLPVVGSKIAEQEQKIPAESPIEKENQLLRLKVAEMENKLLAAEKDKTASLKQVEELQQELLELRAYKEKKEESLLKAREMAEYYSEMKPEEVVEILNNLDDDTVIAILPLLAKDQVGEILAAMESQRAAYITQLLLGNNPAG